MWLWAGTVLVWYLISSAGYHREVSGVSLSGQVLDMSKKKQLPWFLLGAMNSITSNRFGWFDLLPKAEGDGTEECHLSSKLGPSSASEPANVVFNLLIGLEQTDV